jgi:hypothetical protein
MRLAYVAVTRAACALEPGALAHADVEDSRA